VKVLLPLPDRDFDTTEVAVPWKLLSRAGHQVVFATEQGVAAACDPLLLSGVIFGRLGAAKEACLAYQELLGAPEFQQPCRWGALEVTEFDALFLPGGHAPGMRQYLGSELLQGKVAEFWGLGRPVAAICHGPLVLARSRGADGRSVLHDRRCTCLPKPMERAAYYLTAWKLGRYYRTYEQYVEDEVKAALDSPDQFQRGPRVLTERGTEADDRPTFVVRDRNYVSARWPGDSYRIARELIAMLGPERVTG
jgi:putative intracellular protease/amidase